jgi:hypothetical protein
MMSLSLLVADLLTADAYERAVTMQTALVAEED